MRSFLLITLLFSFGAFAADKSSSSCPADGRLIRINDARNAFYYYDKDGRLTHYIVDFDLVGDNSKDLINKQELLFLGPAANGSNEFAQLYSVTDCSFKGAIGIRRMLTPMQYSAEAMQDIRRVN